MAANFKTINDAKSLPKAFSELPKHLNHVAYEDVLAWCAARGVQGTVFRFVSNDGRLAYWAVVKNDQDQD